MRNRTLWTSLLLSILIVSVTSVSQVRATAVWKDITPNAYLNPPENPNITAMVMFPGSPGIPEEGWAVGTAQPLTNATTSLPAIFHYDGSFWNVVPAPRFPDFPATQCPYNLKGLSFGTPGQLISKNDGWAVGGSFVVFQGRTSVSANTNCNNNATAIHWDGVAWRVQTSGLSGPNAGNLTSVFMVSSTDVWAVGAAKTGSTGSIWHWTGVPGLGGGWNLAATVPQVLNSVFMVSPTEGWAVGRNGAIFHYFAGGWTSFPSPFPACPAGQFCELASVFMVSPTEGWAVGTNGVILHYTGGTWSGPVSPGTTSQELFNVFMGSSGEGWAVGGGPTQAVATILHYTGGTWTALPNNLIPISPLKTFSLFSAYFTTATDGWAVGTAGIIIHFDGGNWGSVTSPTINNFTSISFGPPLTGPIDPNNGWAVGNVSLIDSEPTIYHWNGFMWTKGTAIGVQNNLNSVFMLNGGDVWTVGGGNRTTASCSTTLCPVILHYTGGAWNTVTPPPGSYRLKSVFMVSSTEGWAVGGAANPSAANGTLLHYTVSGGVGSWGIFPGPATNGYGLPLPGLNSVFMLGPNEGWAVGDNQTILHYTVTGGIGTWNSLTVSGSPGLGSPGHDDANLTSIFMLSPTSGWAVGGIQGFGSSSAGPVILYWDGTKWTQVATPTIPGGISPTGHTSATLKSVFCSGPNDCWTAGFPGKIFTTLLHWDGVTWTHVPTIPALLGQVPPILTSIYMTGTDTGWIVGSDPEFPSLLAQTPPVFMPEALSTILRAAPFVVTQTATTTVTSILTTQTSLVTGVTTSTNTLFTTTTTTNSTGVPPGPPGSSGVLIPVVLAVVGALVVGLLVILLLFTRRRPPRRRPLVLYPVPRRP